MNGKFMLDTNRIIDLVDGREGTDALRENLKNAKRYASVISRIEALASPDMTPEAEKSVRNFLKTLKNIPSVKRLKKTLLCSDAQAI
jgi:predicted nucleic acid-binding protein